MKKIISILFLLVLHFTLHAQQLFTPLFEINTDADFFTVDALGNSYLVNGSEIVKLDDKGELYSRFNKKDYGNITYVDARDPLRVLVFYKSFAALRILDNKLAEQSVIDLRTLELQDPTLICSADVQGFWVYDNTTSRLTKYNAQLQAISISNDLNKTVNEKINATMLMESDNWLVMNNGSDVLVFDKLGNFFKPVVIPEGTSQIQMMRDNLVMFNISKMTSIDLRKGNTTEMDLPMSCAACKYIVSAGHLYTLEKNKLKAFTF